MRVLISEPLCVNCGECVEVCPEIFKVEGDKTVAIAGEVPAAQHDKCREAADICPVQAIEIEG